MSTLSHQAELRDAQNKADAEYQRAQVCEPWWENNAENGMTDWERRQPIRQAEQQPRSSRRCNAR